MRNHIAFYVGGLLLLGAAVLATHVVENEYVFFAGYVVLQFIVLATGWNVMGGYAGYINFGSAAFFAVGAYTGAALFKAAQAPLVLQVLAVPVLPFTGWNMYLPSWQEVATTILPVAYGIILIMLSYRYLPIFPQEQELNPIEPPAPQEQATVSDAEA